LPARFELVAGVEDCFILRHFLLYLRDQIHPDFDTAILKPLLEDANPAPLTLIMLNRRHNQSLEVLDQQLHDGDQLSFLPPMEGGQ
ncbi:MAG TPA: MoaD/ThiS family protein, partial [Anaerolineaceae bacterium]|nr:MoaD/ThiS family protein [Anaerolineaceae bacterium]